MFLPMSWTSPLTVAITMRAADERSVFSASMYGSRYATARFIARALFTTCGRNIFPAPKRSPTIFIPSMSGPSMTSSGLAAALRASSVSSSMKSTMPWTSACASRSATGASRHDRSSLRSVAPPVTVAGVLDEALGRVVAPVEEDVLDPFEQVGLDVLVDGELARVDDAHVEARTDRVVEERGVHRLANGVVAAEREGEVRDPTRHERARAALLEQRDRVDERLREGCVLLDPGRDGEDVRIEDDVLRRKAGTGHEQVVRPTENLDLALDGLGLAALVERHHDDCGAEATNDPRLLEKRLLPLLERDRVHDTLALEAAEPGFERPEARAVDHDRKARRLGLGREQVEERRHRLLGVQEVGVHVHVEEVRPTAHLLERHGDGALEVVRLDQQPEARGSGHVRPLADDDEPRVGPDDERLEPGEARQTRRARERDAAAAPRRPVRSRACAPASCRSSRRRG